MTLSAAPLFTPARFGEIALANRIVMAPLTRNRAPGQMPNALMAAYYAQRASAGLLITEATPMCPLGHGYADTPGIHTEAQAAAWRPVTDAVHQAGGRIVVQLWHVGRISHTSVLPPGEVPVSSTARASGSRTLVHQGDGTLGMADCSAPRALRTEELPGVVADYRRAARLAMEAGFDGVEIHSANGYLLEQFLRASINDRSDAYGGGVEGRTRLVREVMDAIAAEIGAGRTGIRLSPVTPSNGAPPDIDAQATYEAVAVHAGRLGLAFMEVVEGATGGARDLLGFDFAALKAAFGGPWIVNNGYTRPMAIEAVAGGAADAVAFGRPFIGNPDLVRRIADDLPWAPYERATCYGGGAVGYTDYPAWEAAASAATAAVGAAIA
jgi:N-ethylmaleimide reductase